MNLEPILCPRSQDGLGSKTKCDVPCRNSVSLSLIRLAIRRIRIRMFCSSSEIRIQSQVAAIALADAIELDRRRA